LTNERIADDGNCCCLFIEQKYYVLWTQREIHSRINYKVGKQKKKENKYPKTDDGPNPKATLDLPTSTVVYI